MLTTEDLHDLLEQSQDVVLLATALTGLNRELSNVEWDSFVELVGKEVCELIVRRVGEKFDELEAPVIDAQLERANTSAADRSASPASTTLAISPTMSIPLPGGT